ATADGFTQADGRFSIPLAVPVTVGSGDQLVTVASPPGSPTQASAAQGILLVRSLPRFMEVVDGNLTAGLAANITGRLVEPDGSRALAHARVVVQLDQLAAEATTGADGRFALSLAGSLPVRPLVQRLSFEGDASHQPAEHRTARFVLSPTRLEVNGGAVGRGLDALLQARLLNGEGWPVGHAPVTLQWGQEPARTVLTDAEGKATLLRRGSPADPLGAAAVRAAYAGSPSAGLAPSAARASWVVQAAAEIHLPNGTFPVGAALPAGLLRDAASLGPLGGRDLLLRDGGQQWRVTTDERGRFPVLPPGRTGAGQVLLEATFAGSDSHGPASNASTIDRRIPVALEVRLPGALVAGREALVAAVVLDAEGVPVGDGEVALRIGGIRMGPWAVGGGLARLNLTLPTGFAPGPAEVEAAYSGDALHAPASWRSTLAVLAPVDLHIQAERAAAGGVAVVRVSATAAGRPLPFAPLSLAVGGTGSGLVATTDRDGVATFLLEQGGTAMPVAARYGGDGLASPAMASLVLEPASALSELGPGFPVAVVTLAVAVALGALALVAARLRRQPLEDAFRRIHHLLEARGLTERTILAAYRILEDVAIGKALLMGKAATPRVLEESLRPALPPSAHASLGRFVGLFEEARYGAGRLGEGQRAAALRALQDILRKLPSAAPAAAVPAGGAA
ncbi:MAG TPA: DUF4129 domain-containing protein, partial [Candidatus Thermoplasmatota archaeon]|nr:DUF4129 domain-containing protein [Candidatus Thermoplasmatota archaeon]